MVSIAEAADACRGQVKDSLFFSRQSYFPRQAGEGDNETQISCLLADLDLATVLRVRSEIYTDVLDNGLRLVAQQLPGVAAVAVAVSYRVGFRSEPFNRSGFAHLFEHMMFQGSANVPRGEHFGRVQQNGGNANGNTYADCTDYYEFVPASALGDVLSMEADRMASLRISQENLDVQRDVVKREVELQLANKPYGGFPWTVLPSVLYRKWENAHNGYGAITDLDAATVEDCLDFFRTYYTPANAVVAIYGGVDPEAAVRQARRSFEPVPGGLAPEAPDLAEPPAARRFGVHHDRLAPRPAVAIGSRLPDPVTDLSGYAAHLVLSALLTEGSRGHLRACLDPLDAMVSSSVGFFGPLMATDPDTFVIVAHHPAERVADITDLIDAQLAEIAGGKAGTDEVARAVTMARNRLYQKQDMVVWQAKALAREQLLFGEAAMTELLSRAVNATTPTAVADAAGRIAAGAGSAVLRLVAGDGRE